MVMQLGVRGGKEGKGREGGSSWGVALPVVEPLLTWEPQLSVLGLALGLADFHDQGQTFLQARELPPGVI